jgi:signal transduction histidine kinase
VKTAIDIQQRRAAGSEVIQHQAPVDEVMRTGDRAAADFVKGMSHELHTPLHVIIGLCQLLERDRNASLSAGQRDAVERMERNARSLLQTVNHLLGCLRTGHFE